MRSVLSVHCKDWCWGWNSNTLAMSCEELTHWKKPQCWEGLGAGGEGDDRGWDGWMASPTRWTCVWVNSGSWWWIGRPGMPRFMGSQRVGHDWATELKWDFISPGSKILILYFLLPKLFGLFYMYYTYKGKASLLYLFSTIWLYCGTVYIGIEHSISSGESLSHPSIRVFSNESTLHMSWP